MSGMYLNEISMELRLRQGLRFNLQRITRANGYLNDIGDVLDDPPVNQSAIHNFPAVVIVFGEEKNVAESIDLEEFAVQVFLYCHIREATNPSVTVAQFKQDVQSVLGNYWMLPDAEGVPTCGRAKYVSALPFAKVNGLPQAGVKIGLEITYQQLVRDPSQN